MNLFTYSLIHSFTYSKMTIQDEFIATVSHEMRTPLTSIRGFSQTLLNSWDKIKDEDKKKFVGIIEEQSNRLIHLVENILSVSKMNAGNQVLKQVDINACIKKVLPVVLEQHKQHKYETKLSAENPIAYIDEDKFQQIMTNLLDNAGKYSEGENKVIVSTEVQNDVIKIKVKDFGVGIKEEDFGKVFQKFSRLENHLTSKTQGNGLGLYITKELVDKMGGKISFTSEFGKGTTFEVDFPVYNQEEVLKCSQMSWL